MLRHMRRLEPLIAATVTSTLDAMRDSGPPADLVTSFSLPVPSAVICHLLGVPYADHDFFQKRSQVFLSGATTLEDRIAAIHELRAYLAHLIGEKKRAGSADDLLGRLATTTQNGGMTAGELTGAALLLLAAGQETTANMIGLGTLTLLDHPDEYAALRTNPDSAADTVEELLRYLTIIHFGALSPAPTSRSAARRSGPAREPSRCCPRRTTTRASSASRIPSMSSVARSSTWPSASASTSASASRWPG